MKKVLFLIMAFTFSVGALMAQVPEVLEPVKEYLTVHYVTLLAFTPLIVVVTGYFNQLFSIEKNKQVVSWIMAVVLGGIGYWMQIGIFEDANLIWAIIISAAGGLTANGLYDTEAAQKILELLRAKK